MAKHGKHKMMVGRRRGKRPSKAPLGTGERFKALTAKLKGKVRNPKAVAAAIGRKKYGKKGFQKLAAAGRKRKGRRK